MTLDAMAAASLDLRCSGMYACKEMTVRGPTAPGAVVDVRCDGAGVCTCSHMRLRAAARYAAMASAPWPTPAAASAWRL